MNNKILRIETMIMFHGAKPVEKRIKEISKETIEARKKIEARKYECELNREINYLQYI